MSDEVLKKAIENLRANLTLMAHQGIGSLRDIEPAIARIRVKSLYRFTRCFIGGSVAVRLNSKVECAEGAKVTLFNAADEKIGESMTDNYGDDLYHSTRLIRFRLSPFRKRRRFSSKIGRTCST